MIVASIVLNRSSLDFRPFLLGKNPSNIKRSDGSPDAERAVIDAEAPGMASTLHPASITARINLYAGSLIPGVPASVTTAISFPEFK